MAAAASLVVAAVALVVHWSWMRRRRRVQWRLQAVCQSLLLSRCPPMVAPAGILVVHLLLVLDGAVVVVASLVACLAAASLG